MAAESSLTVRAELSQLRKDLQAATGMEKGEADRLVISLEKRLKAAEKAGKAAAKAQQDAAKAQGDWNKSLSAAQQAAAALPGPLGQIATTVAAASKGLGGLAETAGASAVAVGAGTAAIALLAVGAVKAAQGVDALVESADEAVGRLEKMGLAGSIPADTIAAIDRYEASSRAAGVAADQLRAQVGGLVAVAFEPMISTVAGLVGALDEMLPSAQEVGAAVRRLQQDTRALGAILTLGGSELARYVVGLDDLAESGREAAAELEHLERVQKLLNEAVTAGEKVAQIQADALVAMTGASDAQARLLRETEAIDTATAEYATALNGQVAAMREKLAEDERAGHVAGEAAEQQRQLLADTEAYNATLIDAAGRSAEVRKQQLATELATEEATRKLAEAQRSEAEASREAVAERARLVAINEQELGQLEEARRARAAATNAQIEALGAAREQREVTDAAVASLEEMTAALADLGERREVAAGMMLEAWATWFEEARINEIADSLAGIATEISSAIEETAADQARALMEEGRAEVERAKEAADAWRATQEERVNAELEAGRLSHQEARERLFEIDEQHEARMEAAKERDDNERRLAQEQLRRVKAAQRAAAIAHAATATLALIPSFAYLGPFATAAAGAEVAIALGLALSQINKLKVSEFPGGRAAETSPDHTVLAALEPSESVVTERGHAMLDLEPDDVRAANNGVRASRGGDVHVYIARREIARAGWTSGGSSRPDPRRGRRDPGSRR